MIDAALGRADVAAAADLLGWRVRRTPAVVVDAAPSATRWR